MFQGTADVPPLSLVLMKAQKLRVRGAGFIWRSGTVWGAGLTKGLSGRVIKAGVRGHGEVGLRVKRLTRLWNFRLVTLHLPVLFFDGVGVSETLEPTSQTSPSH